MGELRERKQKRERLLTCKCFVCIRLKTNEYGLPYAVRQLMDQSQYIDRYKERERDRDV